MATQKKRAAKPASKKNSKKTQSKSEKTIGSRLKNEIGAIIIIAVGIFLWIAFQTDAAGQFGGAVSTLFFGSFGFVAYILPYYLVLYGILLFAKKAAHIGRRSTIFFVLIYLMLAILNASRFIDPDNISYVIAEIFTFSAQSKSGGGVVGMVAGNILVTLIGRSGLFIFSFVVMLISILLVVNTPISQFFDQIKLKRDEKRRQREMEFDDEEFDEEPEIAPIQVRPEVPQRTQERKPMGFAGLMSRGQMKILNYMKDDSLFDKEAQAQADIEASSVDSIDLQDTLQDIESPMEPFVEPSAPSRSEYGVYSKEIDEVKTSGNTMEAFELNTEEINHDGAAKPKYRLPSIEFLNKGVQPDKLSMNTSLQTKATKLEETLKNFNVDAKVLQVTQGPAVTRYEIQPNVGVKVSSIVRLADDIALNLEAKSIRLEAPIPGKAAVGIEVENDKVHMVTLRDIISSKEFKESKSKITFAVGRDISGNAITADLKTMPHMLIAGATGSGKSVCINSIIISILYKATPDEVKLVLIDPKVVELGNYNGIPHLLIPVVTEPSKAAAALNWAVSEMTDRYKKFAEEGVRDLESFNNSVKKKNEDDRVMPQIVIIIDELADLMMVASSQVEESICRLAQMARAAGMHLIVATQRPSVDIITGVIKANVPSRIAFAVSSQFDSRTILDMSGAEKLVGKGDMLFNPIGSPKPLRVQGTFISDSEVHKVIEFVKAQSGEAAYSNDVMHTIEKVNISDNDDGDEFLAEAIQTVVKSRQASASGLQRRFRIGYNRAARIIEIMEARGIIGPADGSRPRQVLMTEEELEELDNQTKDLES